MDSGERIKTDLALFVSPMTKKTCPRTLKGKINKVIYSLQKSDVAFFYFQSTISF